MQDKVPGPPLDWAAGEEWKSDQVAKAENRSGLTRPRFKERKTRTHFGYSGLW